MLVADHKHEVVKLLQQTHSEELMAAKIGHEELAKAKSAVKAEAETARVQQREAAERAAKRAAKSAAEEASRLANELAAKEAQLGELQTANVRIADDLHVKEDLINDLEREKEELEREKEELERQKEELEDAAADLADRGEDLHQRVEELEDNNRVLLE
ncbi:hypothetical protein N7465_010184 [Penicillium sp. CMV-2018d]|nr:hypothetical protein N7465_010184 [Penicillium sp. CMV-2018d]